MSLDHSMVKLFQIGTNICEIGGKIGCNRNWEREMLNPSSNKANKGHFLYGPLSFPRKSNGRKEKNFIWME